MPREFWLRALVLDRRTTEIFRAPAHGETGHFSFAVPSEHGYVLGIEDLKWASDPWTGMILGKDSAKPAEITMKVYPATPLTVRVTRGPQRDPVVNAWVGAQRYGGRELD